MDDMGVGGNAPHRPQGTGRLRRTGWRPVAVPGVSRSEAWRQVVRKRAKIDANQAEIVAVLRRAGCTVQSLATIGNGCPDLLCGIRGRNYLLEVKDINQPPSKAKLTEDEWEWHRAWNGTVDVVYSAEQALRVLGL